MRLCTPSFTFVLAATLTAAALPRSVRAECDRLNRPLATRIAAVVRPQAPPRARLLLTPAQLLRFDAGNLHPFSYLLGYGGITLERLGTGGAAPFSAAVAVRRRDGRAEVVTDPYTWATARARELHLQLANAEQAAGYAAEVVSLARGQRPDSASARRRQGGFTVTVSLAPRQGDPAGAPLQLELRVERDGTIGPASSN
jgi:hypothetical protein